MCLVMRRLLNAEDLAAWARGQGFRDLVPSAWHVSVLNSRARLDRSAITLQVGELHMPPSSSRDVTRMGDFVVLTIASLALRKRNAALRLAESECDFHSYRPHVTFSTSRRRDLTGVEPFTGALIFGPEMIEPEVERSRNVPMSGHNDPDKRPPVCTMSVSEDFNRGRPLRPRLIHPEVRSPSMGLGGGRRDAI